MKEHELTPKQRKWLETSRKIRTYPLTRSERENLERLYADMLPREQQELYDFIQEKYGQQGPAEVSSGLDPIEEMQRKVWREASPALLAALAKPQVLRRPF